MTLQELQQQETDRQNRENQEATVRESLEAVIKETT